MKSKKGGKELLLNSLLNKERDNEKNKTINQKITFKLKKRYVTT